MLKNSGIAEWMNNWQKKGIIERMNEKWTEWINGLDEWQKDRMN